MSSSLPAADQDRVPPCGRTGGDRPDGADDANTNPSDDTSETSSVIFVGCTPPGRNASRPAPPGPPRLPASIAVPSVATSASSFAPAPSHGSDQGSGGSSLSNVSEPPHQKNKKRAELEFRGANREPSAQPPPAPSAVAVARTGRDPAGPRADPSDLPAAVVSHDGSNTCAVDAQSKADDPGDPKASGTVVGPNVDNDIGGAAAAAADAAAVDEDAIDEADDDESSQQGGLGPSSFTCWMCLLPIHHSYHDVRRHPVLSVPVCQRCLEQLERFQESLEAHSIRKAPLKSKGKDDDAEDEDVEDECVGCLFNEGSNLLFLCDACPRQFCEDCVAYAHRAGFQSMDEGDRRAIVATVQAQDPWHCLSCKPPPHLRELQGELRAQEDADDDDDEGDDDDDERSTNREVSEAAAQRKLDKWSHELEECEEEHNRVLARFETMGPSESDDSDDAKEDRALLDHHLACLHHKISRLQDDLEGVCRVDLAKWYKRVQGEFLPTVDESARPSEAVEAADREIRERYARWDRERLMNPQQQELPSRDDEYQDVEDLDIDQGEQAGGSPVIPRNAAASDPARGWRGTYMLPNPDDVKRAHLEEDALLEDKGIAIHRVSERFDREATRTEDRAEKKKRKRRKPPSSRVLALTDSSVLKSVELTDATKCSASPPLALTESSVLKPVVPTDATKCSASPQVESAVHPQGAGEAERPASSQANEAAATGSTFGPQVDTPPIDLATTALLGKTKPPPSEAPPSTGDEATTKLESVAPTRNNAPPEEYSDEDDVDADDSEARRHKPNRKGPFHGPKALVLNPGAERVVSISREIATKLKEHQKEGVRFIWNNCFSDLNRFTEPGDTSGEVHGCVLAHNMGLGKSLTTIALIHSLLNHPNLKGRLKSVVIVAPVNTLANWEDEFVKWTGNIKDESRLLVESLSGKDTWSRRKSVQRWAKCGGVLLLGEQLFLRIKDREFVAAGSLLLKANILVLDEAHTMLKNSSNKVFKALSCFETKRRILLTGTPLQNNVTEYFRMIQFANPGAIDGIMDETDFEKKYRNPIEMGLPSDARVSLKEDSVRLQVQLRRVLEPMVHRRGASLLLSDVAHLQQAVLYLRPTREQNRLCNTYKRLQQSNPDLCNFFRMWKDTKKVHNHPGVLAVPAATTGSRSAATCPVDEADSPDPLWWQPFVKDQEALKEVEKGYKMVVLLHILCLARTLGDKVLVFSSCLRTLDFIESIIQRPNWSSFVPTLEGEAIGSYQRNEDYVRIDGTVGSDERGLRVTQFNSVDEAVVFLISSRAGGLGINLTAANRVVLFDSDFNPTISTQCVFRAFRYGQSKPVFCYRLLTEGKMEEKIYARSVTKQGVSYRVIDGKESMNRCFTAQELEDMQQEVFWVQCDRCDRWRSTPMKSEDELSHKWYCEMNDDVENNSCDFPERDQKWYEERMQRANSGSTSMEPTEEALTSDEIPEHVKQGLVQQDEILQHLLGIKASKRTPVVSRYEFHEVLLDADDKAPRRDKSDAARIAGKGPHRASEPAGRSSEQKSPARLKESPLNTSTTKKRATAFPAKAPLGASSPASSETGQKDGSKRGPPQVRSPPARHSKQSKPSPSVPADQPTLSFGVASTTVKSPAKAKFGASAPANSETGQKEGPKRVLPPVRSPPARKAKQRKPSPSVPADPRTLGSFGFVSTTMKSAAPSRTAADGSIDDARSPHRKMLRFATASTTDRSKVLAPRSRRSGPGAAAPAALAVLPPAKASGPELIDLCDSD